jgi:RNA polymerase sigma-70 factor (ECF subfamily)
MQLSVPAARASEPTTSAAAAPLVFERVYDEHVDAVWRSVRRLGVPELSADDVVQGIFLVVHRRLRDFEQRSSLRTWIFSIMIRAVAEHRRTLRRKSPHWLQGGEPADLEHLPDAQGRTPYDAMVEAEAARTIEELLETLDHDKRAVFVLAELEQLTANEIAEATGMTPAQVYSRLRAARNDFERAAARLRQRALWMKGTP